MNISIVDNGKEIRQAFIQKFTMPWDDFQEAHKEWIERCAAKNYPIICEERYLWEMMDYQEISFDQALALLRTLPGEVYAMTENESARCCNWIKLNGVEYKGGVARMDARALADRIEFEWYEEWRLSALDMYLADWVFPSDLYVFDASMEHMIAFTHENDFWELELEQPMKAAASRYCEMYGFKQPEADK